MPGKYDVIIVGAGPAGIFCALELTRKSDLKVLMIDKGRSIEKRDCPAQSGACRRCRPCDMLCGWGGAGAYSDGKLTLSSEIGGWLGEIVSAQRVAGLIERVDRAYLEFGASDAIYGDNEEKVQEIARRAVRHGLVLVPARVRHMGTEFCRVVLSAMSEEIVGKVDILTETEVERIRVRGGEVLGLRTTDGAGYGCRYMVAAPGRSGADWLKGVADELGIERSNNVVDIGVRVEVPAVVLEPLTSELYEPKLVYYSRSFEDRVRTFCMNPYGEVITERYDEVTTVNGHSYAEKKTENTNFALLVDKSFTEPFREPIAYGKYIAWLANLLADGILVQRLGDLLEGHRSDAKRMARSTVRPTLAGATPGDLSLVLPYRYVSDILEMLEAMESLVPGVYERNTLLYGVEVKFYSSRLKVSSGLETGISNLFAAGDGAGISRGLVQASACGLLAADSILRREKKRA